MKGVFMSQNTFSMFPNERFIDLNIYQFGYEQCSPLHSFGPFVRNHYLFHYIISGKGTLLSTYQNQLREYNFCRMVRRVNVTGEVKHLRCEAAARASLNRAYEVGCIRPETG